MTNEAFQTYKLGTEKFFELFILHQVLKYNSYANPITLDNGRTKAAKTHFFV